MKRAVLMASLAIAAAIVGMAAWLQGFSLVLVLLASSYIAAGLFAWYRRPENRTGVLLVVTGISFWAFLATKTRVPILWTIGSALEPAWLPMLAYLLLAFPRGRLVTPLQRGFVGLCLAVPIVSIAGSFFWDPRTQGCTNCQPDLNLLLIHPDTLFERSLGQGWMETIIGLLLIGLIALIGALAARWRSTDPSSRHNLAHLLVPAAALTLGVHWLGSGKLYFPALLVVLTGIVVWRWWRASPPARRILGPMLLPAGALCLAIAAQFTFGFIIGYLPAPPNIPPSVFTVLTNVANVAGIALPATFLLGMARASARHARVSRLILELGDLPPLDQLEQAMSRTLGDPSLAVGRWDTEAERYVTASGAHLDVPGAGSDRVVTFLERDGTALAAIVHDAALLEDHGLLDSAGAAARFVVETDRLQAELRVRLEEVRASRARIVHSGDEARRRMERDLHDGAQQRLVSIMLDLKHTLYRMDPSAHPSLRIAVAGAAEGLQVALAELRELANGIHPSVLTEEGLGSALRSLVERASVPVDLDFHPDRRFDGTVEATAYFVVSEALANVAKHAGASRAGVSVRHVDGRLVVEVEDDGVGGADPMKGSGLRGLADRVGAMDGRFEVKTRCVGGGTVVVAEIPCG